ncbi:MAG: hypothetical protein LBT03_00285 [Holosporales bacterium]|nr:hypothetical protein [Holosporales bacterium]
MPNIYSIRYIAILATLIRKYCINLNIVDSVKLAKDLAGVIDEINLSNIDTQRFIGDFTTFFPEHWKERTQFLLIVTKYLPEILAELKLVPVKAIADIPAKSELRNRINISDIKDKPYIFETESILDEIDFVAKVIERHRTSKRIAVVSPNPDFSELLSHRLNMHHINFTTYVNNPVRSLPADFLKEIDLKFQDIETAERTRLIRELAPFAIVEKTESNVMIVGIRDIKFLDADIIILTELNNKFWRPVLAGEYWLHGTLQQKLGLKYMSQTDIEDMFYSSFDKNAEVYLTRSTQGTIKSAILAKFEAIYNKTLKQKIFNLPSEITAWDIELLMTDRQRFYERVILKIEEDKIDTTKKDFSIAFKNFMRSYFVDTTLAEQYLNDIKEIDFFRYRKCLNILEWLDCRDNSVVAHNDITGKINVPKFNLTICGRCDRIEEYNGVSRIIVYSTSSYRKITEQLKVICLMAERCGFQELKLPVKEIQIWGIAKDGSEPIDIRKVEISRSYLDEFEEEMLDAFADMCSELQI